MKLPLSWLKDYVDVDCSAAELTKKLFSCGFEVEQVNYIGSKINKIVTCKILSIVPHSNSEKLFITQVDAGKYGKLQIITNATNIKINDIVPVALDGATLNNGEKIKTGKLRGEISYGMFCSGEELGINDDWYEGASLNAVLIFKEDFPLGEEVKKLLYIEDVVFDINITANRPDCQSILGLAREVAVVLNKPLKLPDFTYSTCKNISTKNLVKVKNYAFDLCQRYKSHLVKDVVIEPSPIWLKRHLFSMGLRSINNIVDITNYVLLEIGQPMHAFDLSNLAGNEINIRRANNKEKIITLDNKVFELNDDNLVICDSEKPVALAGVMGGLNSEIKNSTKNVLFESAKFSRDNIRRTSRKLGQKSDSSARYEKGIDYLSVENGMNRALHLIDVLHAGKIADDEYDEIDKKITEKVINTKVSKINGVLGLTIQSSYIKNILSRLYFKVDINNDDIKITVPLFREDIEDYPDIAEEIIREYGYDHIVSTFLKTCEVTRGGKNFIQQKSDNIKDLLLSCGFNEAINYSFISAKDFDLLNYPLNAKERNYIKLLNPISEDMAVMRTTLVPSLIKNAVYNINRKNYNGRLFELAKVYFKDENSENKVSNEKTHLCFTMFGDEDFYTCKGIVESILSNFCYGKEVRYEISKFNYLHPTRGADIFVENEYIGNFGEVNPVITKKMDISKEIFIAEIDFDLLSKLFSDKIIFKAISKYPSIERDLAITVDKSVEWGKIEELVKENGGRHLISIKLFDIYEGDQIENDKKSIAFNMIFVSNDKTLEDAEVDKAIERILKALKENLNANLR